MKKALITGITGNEVKHQSVLFGEKVNKEAAEGVEEEICESAEGFL